MDQTIRVSGEKETEIRVKLKEVEEDLKKTALLKWNIKAPLYDRIFFVVFREKDRLGEFNTREHVILLSEDLIYQDFSVLKNVFLHEAAHAIDYALNGLREAGHTPRFREYCAAIGVEEGFEKAKIKRKMDDEIKIKERMAKLMAMSSSPFENEAMVALSKARKLLLENSKLLNTEEKKEDKIYEVDLYEGGRIPSYALRLGSFVGKATGVYILKVLGEANGSVVRAYGSLEEVEAALYLYGNLFSSLDGEIARLRNQGYKITKDSFVAGACPEMEKKLEHADAQSDNALITIQQENRDKARRLCFTGEYVFTKSYSHSRCDMNSLSMGKEFGKGVNISSSMGKKELKS